MFHEKLLLRANSMKRWKGYVQTWIFCAAHSTVTKITYLPFINTKPY